MRPIKFRQPLFDADGNFRCWHHWGFMPDGFVGPVKGLGQEKYEDSLQFTGHCDKNGREIYEGDLIVCNPFEGILGSIEYSDIGIVQYSEKAGAFICLWLPHNERRKSGADNLGSTFPSPLKEVIGNVNQNPELLQEAKS